jgi:predicted flap endonuclease-1-like 5' DNA nuclease
MTAERDSLNAQLAGLDADAQAQAASMTETNARLAALQDELNSTMAARDAAQARAAELEGSVSSSNSAIESLQAQLKDAQDQSLSLAAERDTAQAQVTSLDEEMAGLRAQPSTPAPEAAPMTTLAALATTAGISISKDAAAEAAAAAGVEVKTAACPQDLSEVTAIGSVFEQRLFAAGVGTYWELAQLKDEQFKEILQLNDRQLARMDFMAVRNDALRLALETESVGRIWGGTEPDDFEPLEGIGTTYEKRLYDAGICTYEALANISLEDLMRICPPTKIRKPDYEMWIRQARALTSQPKG